MSWLIFYPITLWRTIVHPLQMMRYAATELGDKVEKQYTDVLSPPLFLLLTLIISHLIELGEVGESAVVKSKVGLNTLISDDTNLIIFRALMFSLFPLVMATRLVLKQNLALDRDSLRGPFYSQCYLTAPFALVVGIGQIMIQTERVWAVLTGAALVLLALLWFGRIQSFWFAHALNISLPRGFWNATVAMVASLFAVALASAPFA